MSLDCEMTFRLGRIAKLSPNLSWLGWIQSALVEVVAWLSDFLDSVLSLIGGPMIVFEYHTKFLLYCIVSG